jgi:hypothetical protein
MENTNEMVQLKEENEKLKLENLKLVNELHRLININRVTYERMTQVLNGLIINLLSFLSFFLIK